MLTKLHQFAGFSALCAGILLSSGCSDGAKAKPDSAPPDATSSVGADAAQDVPSVYEVNSQALLDSALPEELLKEGWVNLFDGQSLFGWFIVGDANWRVDQGVIQVDRGDKSFLCTNFKLADYELSVDFRGEAKTNSGIFLRSQPSPQDVAVDCIELNIAPPDNPFPTGSLVQRKKLEPAELGEFDPTLWHTYVVRMDGDKVLVTLDGKRIIEYTDDSGLKSGHISLQHNEGRVEFKNIHLRPIASNPLKLDASWEDDWALSKKEGAEFKVEPVENGLKLSGGLGQVQSKGEWADFILQATYRLATPEVNSGIFFRCLRDGMLDGYECQLNHAVQDGDPLRPADAGAGAIFRRQPARIVVGDGTKSTYLTLMAVGPELMTWINGVQTVEFVDTRPADPNPRKGLRTDAGPIALQGHDPTTEVVFESIRISELP
jgi:hypothetical protein